MKLLKMIRKLITYNNNCHDNFIRAVVFSDILCPRLLDSDGELQRSLQRTTEHEDGLSHHDRFSKVDELPYEYQEDVLEEPE
ncbi:hypothetical protein GCK72_009584 [Caenorhabditis remanei]|uniref:Uncharacterized protein n=1 Tax=Caenorhabditis remanei TaxID=31234 RepID=A0A6A5H0S9_CAERE|nr:hypothetical protein GCK72_009584 [Caenorhabditis remanei]KAF1761328.1 hypothetical protein GCK72_009584 [Caenorhabditis remanei]